MLKISDQELKFEAKSRGYRPEILEKVYRLLDLLEQFMSVPYLAERLALKGGTAFFTCVASTNQSKSIRCSRARCW